jgi:hypothetical protein
MSDDGPEGRAAPPAAAVQDALARAAAGAPLGPRDMKAIFQIKHTRYAELNKQGAFDHLKLRPAIGPKCFSGVLVHRYLSGEPVFEPTFGRKRRQA